MLSCQDIMCQFSSPSVPTHFLQFRLFIFSILPAEKAFFQLENFQSPGVDKVHGTSGYLRGKSSRQMVHVILCIYLMSLNEEATFSQGSSLLVKDMGTLISWSRILSQGMFFFLMSIRSTAIDCLLPSSQFPPALNPLSLQVRLLSHLE